MSPNSIATGAAKVISRLCGCCGAQASDSNNHKEATLHLSPASISKTASPNQPVIMSTQKKVYVIIHSLWGHTKTLGEEVVVGLKSAGVDAKLWTVKETLPQEVLDKMHAQKFDLPVITAADLPEADGFIFGLSTRYGNASSQMRTFIDSTGGLFASSALDGKFAGVFTVTSSQHGGIETTALNFLPTFAHLGMIFVPLGFKCGLLYNTTEVIGASPYGAGTIAPSDGSRNVSDLEKKIARTQGVQFAEVLARLK
ncbi:NAD(P)H:quinone oxidoreductase, type IV [Batrachochytrium salamandrivorans]|nr:NAD(P)H:quinone oxidoreductase, type IV [Batrachochytrium salamandrivorans]